MTVRVNKDSFNIREKLSELERPIGLKGSELMGSESVQEARDFVSAGRRNLIINGDMRIAQRGTTFASFSSGQYSLDRWMMGSANTNYTITRGTSTLPTGRDVNTFKIECTTATTNWLDPYQGIEDIHIIENQTITMSAWVKTNHPEVNFRQYGMQNFGDLMIPDGQWHHYSATTTLGNLTLAKGGNIGSAFFGITNKQTTSWTVGQYIEFTHFQIELGKNATEFEHRPIGEEFALCQRYYQNMNGNVTYGGINYGETAYTGWQYDATSGSIRIRLPVQMRTNPTASVVGSVTNNPGTDGTIGTYGNAGWMNATGITATETSPLSFRVNVTGLSGSGKDAFGLYFYGTYLTANVKLEAEL